MSFAGVSTLSSSGFGSGRSASGAGRAQPGQDDMDAMSAAFAKSRDGADTRSDQPLEAGARNVAVQPSGLGQFVGCDRSSMTPREEERVAQVGIADCSKVIHL